MKTVEELLLALYGAATDVAEAEFAPFAAGLVQGMESDGLAELLAPHLQQAMKINRALRPSSALSPLLNLSAREKEAAMLFGAGKSTKEIARAMEVSHNSVRNFVQRAYKKLGVGDKAELAVLIGAWSGR